ncbi:hypothetical protein BC6307_21475 [Sutcliffiella cohnii]|uniref:YesK-like protein n=1 Tax=Sutcliffiella cohnii TaxID=33932 RepID=A0A223KW07_9BACI|nr:hypothetical protein [Sutcliffiella cohnii]AST93652.1 hypothetical protein BC6307_21475 [Sutcliffiella cohnii]
MEYVIWFGSVALFVLGLFYFKFFYVKQRKYFIPYLIFQIGITLLVASIFIIGGWAGMAYAFISVWIIGLGLLSGLFVFVYSKIKGKLR